MYLRERIGCGCNGKGVVDVMDVMIERSVVDVMYVMIERSVMDVMIERMSVVDVMEEVLWM